MWYLTSRVKCESTSDMQDLAVAIKPGMKNTKLDKTVDR